VVVAMVAGPGLFFSMVAGVLVAAAFAYHPDSAVATFLAAIYFGNVCLIKY
jgi:hypothetical protein